MAKMCIVRRIYWLLLPLKNAAWWNNTERGETTREDANDKSFSLSPEGFSAFGDFNFMIFFAVEIILIRFFFCFALYKSVDVYDRRRKTL